MLPPVDLSKNEFWSYARKRTFNESEMAPLKNPRCLRATKCSNVGTAV
jgi:hypothetical protein